MGSSSSTTGGDRQGLPETEQILLVRGANAEMFSQNDDCQACRDARSAIEAEIGKEIDGNSATKNPNGMKKKIDLKKAYGVHTDSRSIMSKDRNGIGAKGRGGVVKKTLSGPSHTLSSGSNKTFRYGKNGAKTITGKSIAGTEIREQNRGTTAQNGVFRMVREGTFSSTNTMDRIPCDVCGRCFAPEVLERHVPICEKSASKKRKVFDSAKMRAEGTEISSVKKTTAPSRRAPQKAAPTPAKKSNWRQQHEEFIRSIRGAKAATEAIAQGKPLPPPPPAAINPDYVQCDYCGRRFNETAAERHIPFCREKHQRIGGPPVKAGHSLAAEKQNRRTQYQAPKLKSKTSPGSYSSPANSRIGSAGWSRAPKSGGTQRTSPANRNSYNKYSATSPTSEYSPGMGSALRTGRTNDVYDDARQFSAKQRSGLTKNKYTSNNHRPWSGESSDSAYGSGTPTRAGGAASASTARFCHECGTKYPVPTAKFCCECGIKRVSIR